MTCNEFVFIDLKSIVVFHTVLVSAQVQQLSNSELVSNIAYTLRLPKSVALLSITCNAINSFISVIVDIPSLIFDAEVSWDFKL